MHRCISDTEKDPLGVMLNDYMNGSPEAFLNVWSSSLEMSTMKGATLFRDLANMNQIEKYALAACKGHVLDVGAGAGCHSLVLQSRGFEVDAIDISPGCVEVMRRRGVLKAHHCNVLEHNLCRYDTILMLMNGIGISGSLDGLNLFIQHLETLLTPDGQLLVDSTDLTGELMNQGEDIYDNEEGYCGETDFVMIYKGMRSDPFSWLYVDFELLQTICMFHGFRCDKVIETVEKQFLAKIFRNPHSA